jgi:hypothetical protein
VDDNMCAAPKMDTAKWMPVSLPNVNLLLPKGYGVATSGNDWRAYRAAGRVAGMIWGDNNVSVPESFMQIAMSLTMGQHGGTGFLGGGSISSVTSTLRTQCTTVIGERPVQITTYTWDVADATLSMSAGGGKHFMAVAWWPPAAGQPSIYTWYSTDYKSDLMSMRTIFYTAHFAAMDAVAAAAAKPACADTSPAPRGTVGEFLDTSVVGMLANGASPPLPKGAGTVLLRFDSTGNVAGVSVGASLMPDAAQKELGAIVGSNVIAQKPGSVTHVRIKVTVGDSALSYSLLGVGNCTK